jgi:hypothetical protein
MSKIGAGDDSGSADRIAKVECPNCAKMVHAYRVKKNRVLVTTTTGVLAAGVGGIVGAGIGIATGGWGIAGTIPLGVVGAVVGGGFGYILGDKFDQPRCPNCENQIELGI